MPQRRRCQRRLPLSRYLACVCIKKRVCGSKYQPVAELFCSLELDPCMLLSGFLQLLEHTCSCTCTAIGVLGYDDGHAFWPEFFCLWISANVCVWCEHLQGSTQGRGAPLQPLAFQQPFRPRRKTFSGTSPSATKPECESWVCVRVCKACPTTSSCIQKGYQHTHPTPLKICPDT